MGNNVQTALLEANQNEHLQLTEKIDHECDAPISLMTFFDKDAVRIKPAQKEPIDDINRRFFLGQTTRLLGRHRISLAKFVTTRPPELAEAVFTFAPYEWDKPDIIRLRAVDHVSARDEKNIVSCFHLVWQAEAFPNPTDYKQHVLGELVGDLAALVEKTMGVITQHTLLAIITLISNHEHLFR